MLNKIRNFFTKEVIVEKEVIRKEIVFVNDNVERKYASAKNSPTMNIANDGLASQNKEIETSWNETTSRSLALVRDFPLFSGVVTCGESFVVGDGIYPQITPPANATKRERKEAQKIEEDFMLWALDPKQCDFEGRMNFFEMQALTERQDYEFGEFLAIEQYMDKNLTIQMVEPTQLHDFGAFDVRKVHNEQNLFWRGLEYNKKNRRVINYHFTDYDDINYNFTSLGLNTITIPANRVLHGFKTLRAGQMRGITPFASAILLAYQLRDYLGSEVTAQNMSSRWMAFVTAPPSGYHTDNSANSVEYKEAYGKYVQALDYATIQYLKQGEQVTMNTQTRQSNGFKQFNEIITRYIASSTQMPYELISQDYSGLNYTTLRAVRNDFKMHLKPKYLRKKTQFCQPIFDKWLMNHYLKGNVQGDVRKISKQVKWIYPTLEEIDALKEFKADLLRMRSGIKSPYEVIKKMGSDPQKVLEEFVSWDKEIKQHGLVFPELIAGLPTEEEMIDNEDDQPIPKKSNNVEEE